MTIYLKDDNGTRVITLMKSDKEINIDKMKSSVIKLHDESLESQNNLTFIFDDQKYFLPIDTGKEIIWKSGFAIDEASYALPTIESIQCMFKIK